MAVTVLKGLALLLVLAGSLAAQQSKAIYRQVANVASALTNGNAADAMTPFDKSFAGYVRLRDDFIALTNGYQMVNQIEILDQDITPGEATLTVNWVLTLSDPASGLSETRAHDVIVKLSFLKYQWRIVSFAPLELFDPQPQKSK
jgi:hypothetical protein